MGSENPKYPYIAGKKGIPPEKFVLPFVSEADQFVGGSGRIIKRYAESNRLVFVEFEPEHRLGRLFSMEARLADGQLNFDLLVRQVDDEGKKFRHPDFFGPEFLNVIIGQVFAGRIESIRGLWLGHSYNYQLYKAAIDEGMDQAEAANSTWTGKIVSNHGFQVKNVSDVNELENKIEAIFLPS